ncbi:molybdenum cofactor guanylyltransferase [Pseudonocardia endophytica]|uniref:Probable molybdenum cofactor guanylyltransferase n=1 Tax=Pseudonocardia endophytica TaxID=401976 RepID=A0A4R1HSK3_PSEEN|nr:molybdenum cofactor guanylyltransferase [Pseudonocardia endophytica]TCK24243.1 molybdopterin-guanine dinucleotide biosynthesis protein A [Pseudonocardia endophytica]
MAATPSRPAAGIVLAGGRSSRMGTPKAWLDWHGTPLLARTVSVLGDAVDGPLVVVRAAAQDLPALADGVEVVDDPVPDLGPLPAIGVGLEAVGDTVDRAFVAAVDMPLLVPAFVTCVLDALGADDDVALPVAHGHHQPLAAVYRTSLTGLIRDLTATGDGRPPSLFDRCRVRHLTEDELRAALVTDDPGLASLTNVNTPEEYARARDERPGR